MEKIQQYHPKKIDNEPVYNEKYLKTKIKSYNGKINTIFHDEKTQKKFLTVFVYE